MTRRRLLQTASNGFGYLAWQALAAQQPLTAKAKNVIFCFMPGGVSHMDSFDPKPKLNQLDGQQAKLESYVSGPKRKYLGSPWKFKQYGQSGLPVSELFPHIAQVADELCVIRSMKSEFPLHARANVFLHTGRNFGGFPSLGSWVNYGLGSENKNLPGYLLLNHGDNPPGSLEKMMDNLYGKLFRGFLGEFGGVSDLMLSYKTGVESEKIAALDQPTREKIADIFDPQRKAREEFDACLVVN